MIGQMRDEPDALLSAIQEDHRRSEALQHAATSGCDLPTWNPIALLVRPFVGIHRE